MMVRVLSKPSVWLINVEAVEDRSNRELAMDSRPLGDNDLAVRSGIFDVATIVLAVEAIVPGKLDVDELDGTSSPLSFSFETPSGSANSESGGD